jgi:transcription elongation factor Elf1
MSRAREIADGDECYSRVGPTCPYCGHTETPDDAFYYDEDTTELECGECGQTYDVQVYHSTSWTSSKRETDNV